MKWMNESRSLTFNAISNLLRFFAATADAICWTMTKMTAEEGRKESFFFRSHCRLLFSILTRLSTYQSKLCSNTIHNFQKKTMMPHHTGEMNGIRLFSCLKEFYKNCKCLIMTVDGKKNEDGKFYYKLMKLGGDPNIVRKEKKKFKFIMCCRQEEIFSRDGKTFWRFFLFSVRWWRNLHLKDKQRIFDGMKNYSSSLLCIKIMSARQKKISTRKKMKLKNYCQFYKDVEDPRQFKLFNFNDCKVTNKRKRCEEWNLSIKMICWGRLMSSVWSRKLKNCSPFFGIPTLE